MFSEKTFKLSNNLESCTSGFLLSQSVSWLTDDRVISIAQCTYDKTWYCNSLFERYGLNLEKSIANAVNKRKAEFFAGRYVANKALSLFDIENTDIPIGQHRNPIFPVDVLGSISHTKNQAVAVVALSDSINYLGVDLEPWVNKETIEQIKPMIISKCEEELLIELELKFSQAFTLIYSCKESIFKALYPGVGDYFGFDCAKLVDFSLQEERVLFELTNELSRALPKGKIISCSYAMTEAAALTLVAE